MKLSNLKNAHIYRLPADTWKDNPTLWPELEYPEVYDYLINVPGVYIY